MLVTKRAVSTRARATKKIETDARKQETILIALAIRWPIIAIKRALHVLQTCFCRFLPYRSDELFSSGRLIAC